MAITDLPLFGILRTKMAWHQERQKVLAENVANADTPQFAARDLEPPKFDRAMPSASIPMTRTNSGHIVVAAANGGFAASRGPAFETRPSGNGVNLEEEMIKVSSNQMDYQAATTLYSKSLGLLKTAVGRR